MIFLQPQFTAVQTAGSYPRPQRDSKNSVFVRFKMGGWGGGLYFYVRPLKVISPSFPVASRGC